MSTEFALPDLGEGLPEAEIVRWLVAVGDEIALNQPIAEVETAKAIVELPSPWAGTVRELGAAAGDVVAVGDMLMVVDVAGAAPASEGEQAPAEPAAVEAPAEPAAEPAATEESPDPPNLVGYGAAPRRSGRPQRRSRRVVPFAAGVLEAAPDDVRRAAPHDVLAPGDHPPAPVERPRSTPPVRALARELGVDLEDVQATGEDGVIRRADVERHAAAAPDVAPTVPPAPVGPVPGAGAADRTRRETRTPIRGVRKHTAAAMVSSAFTAPHVTTFLEVDVTATTTLVADLRADARYAQARIGLLAVVAKAVCLALRRVPELNSRWDEAAGEIVTRHYVDLGIAAATERGLVVPHVRDADGLDLAHLAIAIRDLAETARAGRSTPAALTAGTFSITNFGVFGIDAGTPILNPGEAGILGIGAVRRRPWEHRGEIALRDVVTLSLSFDHRLVDGEQASRLLTAVGDVLNDPGRALLLA